MSGNHSGKKCWHHFICLYKRTVVQIDDRLKVLEEHAALGKTVIDGKTEEEAKKEIDIMGESG